MKLTTKTKDPLNYTEANLILHKIGDQLPYFSLTGRVVENGRETVSGAIHKEILEAFPQLEDAAPLHLSDINGKPMHSFENGRYWAGFTVWENGNSKNLSELWRITQDDAAELLYDILEFGFEEDLLKKFHDNQIPRWKQEADNIINKYNLEVVETERAA